VLILVNGERLCNVMIDTNVTISRWPFRRLPLDDTARLAEVLVGHGVTQAWAGSFDGLFHCDLARVNEHLAEDCSTNGRQLLIPFGSVNVMLPDWQDDLHRCHERLHMCGIRLHPGYHGYDLTHADCSRLFAMAAERKLIVQLFIAMEDERTQHPVHQIPAVKTEPLSDLLRQHPGVRLVIMNGLRAIPLTKAAELRQLGHVWFDLAMLEGIEGLSRLVEQVSADRIVFGSHSPFFYFEAAKLKLAESNLPESVIDQVRTLNARALLSDCSAAAGVPFRF
jgi:predicted TIM-barrel fold metal-dependent hydrolase